MRVHLDGKLDVESCPSCSGVWVRHSNLVAFKSLRSLVHAEPGLAGSLANRPGGAPSTVAFGDEPESLECPACGHVLALRSLEGDIPAMACVECGGAWVDDAAVAALLWTGPTISRPALPRTDPMDRFDRFTFHDPASVLLALPLATLAAFVLNSTFLAGLVRPLHIWIHEFGHASVAWFSGRRALPLPIGWTSWEPERSVVVYVALAFLIGALFYTAWKEHLRGAMVLAGVLFIVQGVLTWTFPRQRVELWITFGGIGGEFLLSTMLMILFYFRLPDRVRWDFWRYPVLVIAASAFWQNIAFWARVERGQERIPWGSILGAGDAGGDMDRLVLHHGWSSANIIASYNGLGTACLVVLAAVFVGFIIAHRTSIVRALGQRQGHAAGAA